MIAQLPDLSAVLGLIKDFNSQIDGIWNIYVGVASLLLGALTIKAWRPPGPLLAATFALFAGGNLWAISRYYTAENHLIDQGLSLAKGQAPLVQLLEGLRLPSICMLVGFHVAIDVLVIAAILYVSRGPTAAPRVAGAVA